jgi:cell wall-associated NlpC family hydrolase
MSTPLPDYDKPLRDRLGIIQETDNFATVALQNRLNYQQREQERQRQLVQQQQQMYGFNQNSGQTAPQNLPQGEGPLNTVVDYARKQIGKPYIWGATDPNVGFDCSFLVQQAYKQVGINLPRVSNQQGRTGVKTAISNLRPGDLIFWDNSSRNVGADHVAVYAGNGYIIEAPGRGKQVRYRQVNPNDQNAWGIRVVQ